MKKLAMLLAAALLFAPSVSMAFGPENPKALAVFQMSTPSLATATATVNQTMYSNISGNYSVWLDTKAYPYAPGLLCDVSDIATYNTYQQALLANETIPLYLVLLDWTDDLMTCEKVP